MTPTRLHIAPRRGWLNDPNGVVYHQGRWHVFFQHNPAKAQHGNIHWGHVSSPDLLTWTEHPVAFGPQPGGPDRGGCWSGVFMAGAKAPAMAYSGIGEGAADSTVCVRYALDDDLLTWSDPFVVATAPEGIGLLEMRDPFLFSWEGRRYALLGAGLNTGRPVILLYSCDDLESWRFERVWLTEEDPVLGLVAPANIWECPQLVRICGDPESWVLMISLWVTGLTERVVHTVGSMSSGPDGLPLLALRTGAPSDHGPVFYAPQIVQDVPDDLGPLMFGWVRDDPAPEDDHHASSGSLTLPRRLSLRGDELVQQVDPAVAAWRAAPEPMASETGLPSLGMVRVTPAATDDILSPATTATLTGAGGKVTLVVSGGLDLWVDGEVVEAYAADGTTTTLRQPKTEQWTLSVTGGTTASSHLRAPGAC